MAMVRVRGSVGEAMGVREGRVARDERMGFRCCGVKGGGGLG